MSWRHWRGRDKVAAACLGSGALVASAAAVGATLGQLARWFQ